MCVSEQHSVQMLRYSDYLFLYIDNPISTIQYLLRDVQTVVHQLILCGQRGDILTIEPTYIYIYLPPLPPPREF